MDLSSGIEALEVNLLLEAIFQRFGNDFRHHNKNYLRHKLRGFMEVHSIFTLSALQEKVLHDSAFIEPLLCALDRRSSGLFEHPEQVLKMRQTMIPWLRSYPAPKIWIAECVAAEEIFGWIVFLIEENLYHKTELYVTGPNLTLLNEAKQGKFSARLFPKYEKNYCSSGGNKSLAHYCTKIENDFVFDPELGSNITWTEYNLGTDASFNEFEAIVCCGGLAGFTSHLRHRAIRIFFESQPAFGFLTMAGDSYWGILPHTSRYRTISEKYGLYQRGG